MLSAAVAVRVFWWSKSIEPKTKSGMLHHITGTIWKCPKRNDRTLTMARGFVTTVPEKRLKRFELLFRVSGTTGVRFCVYTLEGFPTRLM